MEEKKVSCNNMEDIVKQIAELHGSIKDLTGAVTVLVREVMHIKKANVEAPGTTEPSGLTPEVRLTIKRMAEASARGDSSLRRQWNFERRKEIKGRRI